VYKTKWQCKRVGVGEEELTENHLKMYLSHPRWSRSISQHSRDIWGIWLLKSSGKPAHGVCMFSIKLFTVVTLQSHTDLSCHT